MLLSTRFLWAPLANGTSLHGVHPGTGRVGGLKYCSAYGVRTWLRCYGKKDHTDPVRGTGECGGLYPDNRKNVFFSQYYLKNRKCCYSSRIPPTANKGKQRLQ